MQSKFGGERDTVGQAAAKPSEKLKLPEFVYIIIEKQMLYTAAKFHLLPPCVVVAIFFLRLRDTHFAGTVSYIIHNRWNAKKAPYRHPSANGENVNKINSHGVETQGRIACM